MINSTSITGFSTWVNFLRATLALGGTVAAITWATVTYGLDDRYAGKSTEQDVANLQTVLFDVRKQQLQDAVLVAKQTACKVNGETKTVFDQKVHNLSEQYKKLNGGSSPYVPNCEDL